MHRVLTLALARVVGLPLLAVLLTVLPMAHASPPDQTWLPGLYDDGDHDDVVLVITDTAGSPAIASADLSPARVSAATPTMGRLVSSGSPARIRSLDRAPPIR